MNSGSKVLTYVVIYILYGIHMYVLCTYILSDITASIQDSAGFRYYLHVICKKNFTSGDFGDFLKTSRNCVEIYFNLFMFYLV